MSALALETWRAEAPNKATAMAMIFMASPFESGSALGRKAIREGSGEESVHAGYRNKLC
jgi:hypothetical protein